MMQTSLPVRLRVLRAQSGLTLTEAADKIGIMRDTLSLLERGKRRPYMPTLAKIAAAYGIPVEELVNIDAGEEPVLSGKAEAPEEAGLVHPSSLSSNLGSWANFINGLAGSAEEWRYSVLGAYGTTDDLPEQDFLLFAGRVSDLLDTWRWVSNTVKGELLEPVFPAWKQPEAQDLERVAAAYRRLSRVVVSVVTPEFERRLNELADAERASEEEAQVRRGGLYAVREKVLNSGVA